MRRKNKEWSAYKDQNRMYMKRTLWATNKAQKEKDGKITWYIYVAQYTNKAKRKNKEIKIQGILK